MGYWKQITPCDISKMGRVNNYCLQNVRLAFGITAKCASAKDAMNLAKKEGTFHTDNIPTNVAVPIFAETGNPYGHVMIDYYGDVYSDGKHLTSLKGMTVLGWSETLNGVRIVEWVDDKPSTDFKEGDSVRPIKPVDYNGKAISVKYAAYMLAQLRGNRAVLAYNGVIMFAVNTNNLELISRAAAAPVASESQAETKEPVDDAPSEPSANSENFVDENKQTKTSSGEDGAAEDQANKQTNQGDILMNEDNIIKVIDSSSDGLQDTTEVIEEASGGFDFKPTTKLIAYIVGDICLLGSVEVPLVISAMHTTDPVALGALISGILNTAGIGILTVFKLLKAKR